MAESLEGSPTGLSAGRALLLAAGAGYLVLVVYQAFTLPDRVPGHIGPTGEVSWWGGRASHVVIASLVGIGLFVLMWFVPRLLAKLPKDLVNLPHKDYWLAPANLPRAQRMMADDMGVIGAATLAFAGFAMWEIGNVARGSEVATTLFWVVFALYMGLIVAYSLWMSLGSRWKPSNRRAGSEDVGSGSLNG